MLAWEQNKFTLHASSTNKECAIMMETIKRIVERIEIRGCDGITAHNVTKIEKH
jgi:hypothetical protein